MQRPRLRTALRQLRKSTLPGLWKQGAAMTPPNPDPPLRERVSQQTGIILALATLAISLAVMLP